MHRASIRSTVAQHINTKDEIFDKYLEEPDDGIEPRKPMDEDVEMLVDLTATHDDHEEVLLALCDIAHLINGSPWLLDRE